MTPPDSGLEEATIKELMLQSPFDSKKAMVSFLLQIISIVSLIFALDNFFAEHGKPSFAVHKLSCSTMSKKPSCTLHWHTVVKTIVYKHSGIQKLVQYS